MRRWLLALGLAAFVFGSAGAQTASWTGPDLSRDPDGADMDFALAEICFPWLLQDAALDDVTDRDGVRPARQPPPGQDPRRSFQVDRSPLVVALEERADGRDCTLAVAGDAAPLRATFDTRMAQWPEPLVLAPYQYPPDTYDSREFFCSSRAGPQSRLLVSMRRGRQGAIMATLSVDDRRMPPCDEPAPSADAVAFAADPGPAGIARRVVTLIGSCREVVKDSAAFDAEAARLGLRGATGTNGDDAWMSMAAGNAAIRNPDTEVCMVQSEGPPGPIRDAVIAAMTPIEGSFRLPPPPSPPSGWDTSDAWRVCNAGGAYILTLQTAPEDSDLPSALLQMVALVPPPDPCPTTLIMPPESVPRR